MFSNKKWYILAGITAVIVTIIIMIPKHDMVRVIEVSDSNTFIGIGESGHEEVYRMIGIERDKSKRTECKMLLDDKLLEHFVKVEFGLVPIDAQGRKLVYVFTQPGQLLNSELVESGLFDSAPKFPNRRYFDFIDK